MVAAGSIDHGEGDGDWDAICRVGLAGAVVDVGDVDQTWPSVGFGWLEAPSSLLLSFCQRGLL